MKILLAVDGSPLPGSEVGKVIAHCDTPVTVVR